MPRPRPPHVRPRPGTLETMTPLLRRATGDDKAFERLYQRHVKDVYHYSLAVLGKPADAEDVTQTTCLTPTARSSAASGPRSRRTG